MGGPELASHLFRPPHVPSHLLSQGTLLFIRSRRRTGRHRRTQSGLPTEPSVTHPKKALPRSNALTLRRAPHTNEYGNDGKEIRHPRRTDVRPLGRKIAGGRRMEVILPLVAGHPPLVETQRNAMDMGQTAHWQARIGKISRSRGPAREARIKEETGKEKDIAAVHPSVSGRHRPTDLHHPHRRPPHTQRRS